MCAICGNMVVLVVVLKCFVRCFSVFTAVGSGTSIRNKK